MSPWVLGLFAGYCTAVLAWMLLDRLRPGLWPRRPLPSFQRPWVETGFALLAVVAILALGQLWSRGVRLPSTNPVTRSLNQVLIFSPLFALLAIRRQPPATGLLRPDRRGVHLAVGLGLAALALAAHVIARRAAGEATALVPRVWLPDNLDVAVQVFLEDLGVGILLARLSAAAGARATVIGAALLFAAAHIPAMVAQGAPAQELLGLARDVVLGWLVLGSVLRSGDILWFWPIHVVMDLTQFPRVMAP